MRLMKQWTRTVLCGAVALCSLVAGAQPQAFQDATVQAPQLSAPQRGSLVGQYAQTAFGPSDVTRGTFALPSPFSVPTERGPLLASPFPSYSPEGGLSEWGMGWNTSLTLYRWRAVGSLDFATDELNGPWGRMVRGADGAWYPSGLASRVRVVETGTSLVAYLEDGSRWTFGGSVRVESPLGVYSWHLEEAESVTGQRTRFAYVRNSSGRPFVSAVEFGGRGTDFQYRAELSYQSIPQPFVDYRSGVLLQLDRRVSSVKVLARDAVAGTWGERWHYTLAFLEDELGPGFFLSQVRQVYSSGEVQPPSSYTYQLARQTLQSASFELMPELDPVLATYGEDIIQPAWSSSMDANLDGRADMEERVSNTLLVRDANGFRAEPLPPMGPDTVAVCRQAPDPSNTPRLLAQMWRDSNTYQVVHTEPDPTWTQTEVTVCNREGQMMARRMVPADWMLGANTRLVDLDKDLRPDLVRVYAGGYDVLPNTGSEGSLSFGAQRTGGLMPYFSPLATWVHDFNGDGLADLVARGEDGLTVWYGRGRFEFDPTGQSLPVLLSYGGELVGLSDYELSFADVNRDGLTDMLAVQSGFTSLFINQGHQLVEVPFNAQSFFDGYASPAVVQDFSGRGGTQLTSVKWGHAYTATLDGPGTSQLVTADDGKGTRLGFEYRWSPPLEGARQRQAVLAALTVQSSGHGTIRYTYQHEQPTLHPQGRFLLGYGQVTRADGISTERVRFHHDADRAGLVLSSATEDTRTPSVRRTSSNTYESVLYQQVPYLRLQQSRSGWSSAEGSVTVEESTRYAAYDGLCPARVVQTTSQGTLTTERQRASLPSLSQHLHCLEGRITLTGSHADSGLDFQHVATVTRNDAGLVERVESTGPVGAQPLVLQQVSYTPGGSISQISAPGRGSTTFDYEAGTLLLRKVTSPDGRVLEVTDRRPLTDAILSLRTTRGTRTFTQSFRYDGQERLLKQWDDLGGTSETSPSQLLAYQYATALQPGAISVTSLVESQSGARTESVEWQTAAGEALGSAQRIPEGWSVDGLTTRDRGLRETRTYTRPILAASTVLSALTHADLLFGARQVSSARAAGLGHEVDVLTKLHADVEREVTTGLSLEEGWLRQQSTENATHTTTTWMDAGKRVVKFEDAAGTRHTYVYDALGRLRGVLLPDGKRHAIAYDEHGRPARVVRDGIATVDFWYDSTTGLLRTKRFLSPGGVVRRTESQTYDAIGRQVEVLHTDVATGATQRYRFFHDGATPDAPNARTDVGLLTAVEGPGYLKTFEYRADGKLARRVVRLDGWRTVESQVSYAAGGDAREELTALRDANGALLSTSTLTHGWDTYGRPSTVHLNGELLATLGYDGKGQLAQASFGSRGGVTFGYDDLTRQRVAVAQAAPGWSASTSMRFNPSGLVGSETFSAGGQVLARSYGYSAQGFLTSSLDPQHAYDYAFDGSGLPLAITRDGVRRDIRAQGNVLSAGEETYTFDELGRTTARGELSFTYGPNGSVASARRGTTEWRFLYDESGQRLLKLGGANPVAAYLEGGAYLDSSGLTEPLRLGGQTVGLVKGGTFRLLATDTRGTLIADADGTARLASPFGEREVHPADASVLDYVQKGYDADLGLIRMGVRDYDPRLGRFLTPDPLFLEHPERCMGSPVECNLYGYAKASPLNYVDPKGTCSAPSGLQAGQVGICIEAFIPTEKVPGSWGMGLGDNRGFEPLDPSKTARFTSWLKVSFSGSPESGQVSVTLEQRHVSAKSEVLTHWLAIPGGIAPKVLGPTYSFRSDSAQFSYENVGLNGWARVPGVAPVTNGAGWLLNKVSFGLIPQLSIPTDTIDLKLTLNVGRDGKVTLTGGGHDGYPSYGIYAYSVGQDGAIQAQTLRESAAGRIEQLAEPLDQVITPPARP